MKNLEMSEMVLQADKVYVKSVWFLWLLLSIGLIAGESALAQDTRIKDLVNIRGVRTNQLVGFGLVIGLQGTGDSASSLATNQAAAQMLARLGIAVDANAAASQNIAAVVATVDLPAFARIGDRVDVKISAVGDASSLAGGTLVLTPLRAGDQRIYVVGQGSVVVGQASGQGARVLTVARVPSGGIVEREFIPEVVVDGVIHLSLRQPDFTTNARISERINEHFKGFYAQSRDPSGIDVTVPLPYSDRVIEFISELERLNVTVDRKARVVLNERTGTVVMGGEVTIGAVAISHGDLTIQVDSGAEAADGSGEGAVTRLPSARVGELIEMLNALGMKPADLVGVLQALHAAGALQAELEFM